MVVVPALQTEEAGKAKQPKQAPFAMVIVSVVPVARVARVRLVTSPIGRCGIIGLLVRDNGIELVGRRLKVVRFCSDLVRLGSHGVFGRRRTRDDYQSGTGEKRICDV
jgi:hypothetical protein